MRHLSAGGHSGRLTRPARAACFITSPASKLPPLFQTARVTAAILRATVTRADSGLSPLTSSSAYHDLKGSRREAACAAPLKTYFSVRLWLRVSPRVAAPLFVRRSCARST